MLALAMAAGAAPARADGDPASDVLTTQPLFLPQDAGIPAKQQAQLDGLLQKANRGGYPIRVAVVATSTDMGSVTELWRQPQTYARFLGQELSLVYHGPLLVVMPDGFGFEGFKPPLADEHAAVAGLSTTSGQLGQATVQAIQRLAERAGHSLQVTATSQGTSGPASSETVPLIALAVGALIVAVAWAASLRARPLRVRGQKTSSA
ncbi:MAG TPA: hypothetical protein VFB39_00080 [Solirubrobacteraceae bacterium]|nr:hypothetical protein [Solirubrobacteraceae bacterium]